MNLFERGMRHIDDFQQRNRALSLVFGVLKKFGDDNAGTLVQSLAHSAFGAIFPLLLLLVTVLGIVLSSHPAIQSDIMHSTVSQFPIIGNDLASNIKAMHRHSVIGLTVGIFGLLWGSLGLAQNGIFTMAQIWNLPGPERPNYIKRLERSVAFLAILGAGVILSTFFAAAVPAIKGPALLALAGGFASALVNFAEYLFAFRVLTPAAVRTRQLVPGATFAAIGWAALQSVGGFVVGHYLKDDTAVYGLFAIVLGLFAWVYLACELTVYAAELNVVLARRLWPRAIVQPPLTEADRASMAAQALQNQRRPEQRVEVTFDGYPTTEREVLEAEKAKRAAKRKS
jgi:YihY family inner membrane protein